MICENLLTLRKRLGYSQERVAEAVGVSRQAVAKWESGETVPDILNCQKLARLYDVSLDELVQYEQKDSLMPIAPKGKYMFGTVTVGEKGQIVIPVKARKIFDIHPGDDLVVLGDVEQGLALLKTHFLLDVMEEMKRKGGTP